VFHTSTIGLVFENVSSFTAIVKKFVYGSNDPEELSENDVESFKIIAIIFCKGKLMFPTFMI